MLKNARNEKDGKLIYIMMYNKECLKEDSDTVSGDKDNKDKGTSSSKDKSDEQVLIIIVFIISLLS